MLKAEKVKYPVNPGIKLLNNETVLDILLCRGEKKIITKKRTIL